MKVTFETQNTDEQTSQCGVRMCQQGLSSSLSLSIGISIRSSGQCVGQLFGLGVLGLSHL